MRIAIPCGQLQEAQPVAMRVEAHCFGVDSNRRSEVDTLRKIIAIEIMGHSAQRLAAAPQFRGGAQEKTRTSTSFRPLEPESSASTNSATWASRTCANKPGDRRCQRSSALGLDHNLDRVVDSLARIFESGGQLIERKGVGVNEPGVESPLLHQGHRPMRGALALAANPEDVDIFALE